MVSQLSSMRSRQAHKGSFGDTDLHSEDVPGSSPMHTGHLLQTEDLRVHLSHSLFSPTTFTCPSVSLLPSVPLFPYSPLFPILVLPCFPTPRSRSKYRFANGQGMRNAVASLACGTNAIFHGESRRNGRSAHRVTCTSSYLVSATSQRLMSLFQAPR